MPRYKVRCDVSQAYNYALINQPTIGHVTEFQVGDLSLLATERLTIPTSHKEQPVVGPIESLSYDIEQDSIDYLRLVYFLGHENKNKLVPLIGKWPCQITFSFRIYQYNGPPDNGYFVNFRGESITGAIVEEQGALDIGIEQNLVPNLMDNMNNQMQIFRFHVATRPIQGSEGEIRIAESKLNKRVVVWKR